MRWIVSTNRDIAVDSNQLNARRTYIQRITSVNVSPWYSLQINGQQQNFLYCISEDLIDGTFITAHIGDVMRLCCLKEIYSGEFIIANTCKWERMSHKVLLQTLNGFNQNVQLWFAKQELSIDNNYVLRQSTTLNNIGQFGFQTSLSERELFRNRSKGIITAIQLSFDRVSPILLPGD